MRTLINRILINLILTLFAVVILLVMAITVAAGVAISVYSLTGNALIAAYSVVLLNILFIYWLMKLAKQPGT